MSEDSDDSVALVLLGSSGGQLELLQRLESDLARQRGEEANGPRRVKVKDVVLWG